MSAPGLWARYAHWLHLRWPAGMVEPWPRVRADGSTNVPGLYVTGDLCGRPLLKDALDTGARTAAHLASDPALRSAPAPAGSLDLVIVGGGVSGFAAALEARRLGLTFQIVEADEPFFTPVNYPARRSVFAYPSGMQPAGELRLTAEVKETLVAGLCAQVASAGVTPIIARAERVERAANLLRVILAGAPPLLARRVIVAIGRSGCFRRIEVPGEELEHVFDRLHDPQEYAGRRTLVVGDGEHAAECAIALAEAGAEVTLVHRGAMLTRPRYETLSRLSERLAGAPTQPWRRRMDRTLIPRRAPGPGTVTLRHVTRLQEIHPGEAVLREGNGPTEAVPMDAIFVMVGREAPGDFLRRCGVELRGERKAVHRVGLVFFLLLCAALCDWRSGGLIAAWWHARGGATGSLPGFLASAGDTLARAAAEPRTLIGTLAISAAGPSFWWALALSALVVVFGARRMRRRRTPYVTAQTLTLMAVQSLLLFLLPEVLLPWLGHNGWLPRGLLDALFPATPGAHGREYWRAYGLVLAWPLQAANVFTREPLVAWLAITFVQVCVILPLAVRRFGKGAYCGWVCPRGALAETLGDTQRWKMPHGPHWNRLGLAGQFVLGAALALLVLRIAGWLQPAGSGADVLFEWISGRYRWTVDVLLAGVLGYGVFFLASGRTWCRFLCPLGALLNVMTRASRSRILAEKERCISCGLCTATCHMGVDIMGFARLGRAVEDPQCVRCSACVHDCPTGALAFGRVDAPGARLALDSLPASPVRTRERL
jgi:NosR/NirI family transcriptional regulator, nitrous oxide reductase regulator